MARPQRTARPVRAVGLLLLDRSPDCAQDVEEMDNNGKADVFACFEREPSTRYIGSQSSPAFAGDQLITHDIRVPVCGCSPLIHYLAETNSALGSDHSMEFELRGRRFSLCCCCRDRLGTLKKF